MKFLFSGPTVPENDENSSGDNDQFTIILKFSEI